MAELKMGRIPLQEEENPRNSYPQESEGNYSLPKAQTDEEVVKELLASDEDGEEEYDEGFEEWLKSLSVMTDDEARQHVFDHIKSQVSEEDSECLDEIVEILNNPLNKEKNTDLEFIVEELKKKHEEINPIVVFQYLTILQGLKLISLEK